MDEEALIRDAVADWNEGRFDAFAERLAPDAPSALTVRTWPGRVAFR
jgi:hypothetical protein